MKLPFALTLTAALLVAPFAMPAADEVKGAADSPMFLNPDRGKISVSKSMGAYADGSHFGKWNFPVKVDRWGMYEVRMIYGSERPKMGVQAKLGDLDALKNYAPRTGGIDKHKDLILGVVYVPAPGEYTLYMLTGDKSNDESFQIARIELVPCSEAAKPSGETNGLEVTIKHDPVIGQGIDGGLVFEAGTAITRSERMRYEPKKEKNCLGFWTDAMDWAEWPFRIHSEGKYRVSIVQGCGADNGGSKVALVVGDEIINFEVEETGGFQNWKTLDLGEIEIGAGEHRLAIKPLEVANKAVMDVQKVTLTPVE